MQEYKDWDGNLLPNSAPTVRNMHIGDIIKIKINDEDRIGRASKYGEYEVIGVYPRTVLTRDKKTGFRRSFSYGDLLTMGLEIQKPEIETMRRSYAKNVFTEDYNEDDGNYRNVCLVGGPGEDADRVLVTVGSGEGLDRYEMFYNASGYSEDGITAAVLQDQLRQKGLEKMSAYYIAKAFEVKINKDKAMEFALGDYVTCQDTQWGITVDTQVKVIQKGYSKTEASYVITLGDDVPTLINLIKAKE